MIPDLSNMLSWWQWLILAAVPPAIVALYFLKLKRRPVEVPSTYLWHKSIEDLHVNSIWQRLRRNLLLWLQLLVVLLADPGAAAAQLAGVAADGQPVHLPRRQLGQHAGHGRAAVPAGGGKAAGGGTDRPDARRRRGDDHQLRRYGPRRAELHRQSPAAPRRPWRTFGRRAAQRAFPRP